VTFVIPLGLPGMGKSTFNERILENYFSQYNLASGNPHVSFVTISNDDVRQKLITDYLSKNKKKTRDDAFLATQSKL
jgi:adenylate kinase family enzyme